VSRAAASLRCGSRRGRDRGGRRTPAGASAQGEAGLALGAAALALSMAAVAGAVAGAEEAAIAPAAPTPDTELAVSAALAAAEVSAADGAASSFLLQALRAAATVTIEAIARVNE
jgi:hypothetical protein